MKFPDDYKGYLGIETATSNSYLFMSFGSACSIPKNIPLEDQIIMHSDFVASVKHKAELLKVQERQQFLDKHYYGINEAELYQLIRKYKPELLI